MRLGRRYAHVGIAALVLVLAACSGSTSRADDPPAANRPPATGRLETLPAETVRVTPAELAEFVTVAVRPAVPGTSSATLRRWVHAPTLRVLGAPTAEDLTRIGEASRAFAVATGIVIRTTDGPADVTMHFVARHDFAPTLGLDTVEAGAVGLTRLQISPRRRGVITGAEVVVATDDLQVSRNRTIGHELGHVLGLQHSLCPSSLMDGDSNSGRSVRWSMSPLDVRTASLLYDRALRPGMDEAEVRDVLVPTAPAGAECGPVDLELIRAAGTDRHYFCATGPQAERPCTSDLSHEPGPTIVNPDAWTDGRGLHRGAPG